MIERRVAAIAVKRVYSPCFTDAVGASERMGVPVYLYSGAYHERVAFESLVFAPRFYRIRQKRCRGRIPRRPHQGRGARDGR